ncbi:terpene synthase family protein [Streptomyces wuyuanensis]|uniref:terpene synthase family protein n=1 Tax=Streptomyces wuyuanensis TaxID=1196353 RepID=UPI003437BD87
MRRIALPSGVALPNLVMPIPRPAGWGDAVIDKAGAELWVWIEEFTLCPTQASRRHLERTRPELCAARFFPHAPAQLAAPLAQHMAWSFLADDQFDDGNAGRDSARCRAAVDSLTRTLRGEGLENAGPLERAMDDWWRRLAAGRSASWCRDLQAHMQAWWQAAVTETADRAQGRMPGIDEYLANRRHSIALDMFLDLCEVDADVDLSEAVRPMPAFLRMRDAAAWNGAFLNDILSLAKEMASGYHHNAVLVIQHETKCSLQEAVDRVGDMGNRVMQDFIQAYDELDEELSAAGADLQVRQDAAACAERYRDLVRGDFDWHFENDRYASLDEIQPAGTYVADLFPHASSTATS